MGLSLHLDFETRGVVDLLKRGVYVYAMDKHTEALMASYRIGNGPRRRWKRGEPCPADIREHVESGGMITAHNAAFERLIWWHVLAARYGWPKPKIEQFRCTATTAAAMSLPRSLDRLGAALDLSVKKDKRGMALIKAHSIPVDITEDGEPIWDENPAGLAAFHDYCDVDVDTEAEADNRLVPLSDYEQAVYVLSETINDRGIRIDVESAHAAVEIAEQAKHLINRELVDVTEGQLKSVTEGAAMIRWLNDRFVMLDSLSKDGVESLLFSKDLDEDVRRVLELRLEGTKPSVEKIAAMLARCSDDGRARGVYLCHGAGQTGRFCVDADTLVDTPQGPRKIVDLQVGVEVITHRSRAMPVTAVIFKGVEQMFKLTGPRGETVTCTAGHRVLTRRGWRKVDECFEKTSGGPGTLREGLAPISLFDARHVGYSGRHGPVSPDSGGDRKTEHPAGRALAAKERELLTVEDRSGKSDVWAKDGIGEDIAPGARGSLEWGGVHIRASFDRSEGARLGEIAGESGSSSHRRGQDEQLPGQSSDRDEAWSQIPAQADAWSLIPVGEREVWDISVAGDASYLAQGLIHHNSSRGLQAHNMPKYRKVFEEAKLDLKTLFSTIRTGDPAALQMMYGETLGRPLHLLSDAVRSFIWAAPGHEFINADFTSIEGVVAAWVADEEWKVQAFRDLIAGTGPGMYELLAASIYNVDVASVTKPQRSVGKVGELSMGYQGGVGALSKMAAANKLKLADVFEPLWETADLETREAVDKRFAERLEKHDERAEALGPMGWKAAELIKVGWRAKHPAIVQSWHDVEEAATSAVVNPGHVYTTLSGRVAYVAKAGFLWCRLPSGRCLAYGSPRVEELEAPWADKTLPKKERETKRGLTVLGVEAQTEKWMRFPVYGGSFFNNIVQGSSRDILVHGMFNAEKAGYPIVLHTHDECMAELPVGVGDVKEFERIICDLPPWAKGIPLKASGWKGKRYRKD